ncbi:MAG: DNA repair protein RecO [Candidatus Eremiobacteraeota bacterium]|nr:DNA repair protein RecO [Candidatus Eremiobacteraeota bacterium]
MTHARSYKTRGIVLRARALGEADRIITMFSDERGKVSAVAKGVRRAKSHFAGRLEFGNECQFTMHQGRSLDVIVTAEIVRAPWERLVDPQRFLVASLVAELIEAFSEPDLALPDVYRLLSRVLTAIAVSEAPQTLVPRFCLQLLSALGLEPPADACVRCSEPLGELHAWCDPDSGGFICEACRERWRDLFELDSADLLNLIALSAPRGASRAALLARPRIAQAVEAIVTHHLGRRPKAGLNGMDFAAHASHA